MTRLMDSIKLNIFPLNVLFVVGSQKLCYEFACKAFKAILIKK